MLEAMYFTFRLLACHSTVHSKTFKGETFVVFADFSLTAKVFLCMFYMLVALIHYSY